MDSVPDGQVSFTHRSGGMTTRISLTMKTTRPGEMSGTAVVSATTGLARRLSQVVSDYHKELQAIAVTKADKARETQWP